MDDCIVHSPTLQQHLLDVAKVLEIFRRQQLYAKNSRCEFRRQELGFLSHPLSAACVSEGYAELAAPLTALDGALHVVRCRSGFHFDVTPLPGASNPTDPLSRRAFADGDGPAASTGDPDPERKKELFFRLGRDAPAPALLAAIRLGWAHTRSATAAAYANVQEADAHPSTPLGGEGCINFPVY